MSKIDIESVIEKAVNAGIQAGRTAPKRAYKETEKRLYAYPVLAKRIADNEEEVQALKRHGCPEGSTDIKRFRRSGQRLSSEEITEGLIQDLEAAVAADEHEIRTIDKALEEIAGDEYYNIIPGIYFEKIAIELVAEAIPCAVPTVFRQRGRLIQTLAVWLYGVQAVL